METSHTIATLYFSADTGVDRYSDVFQSENMEMRHLAEDADFDMTDSYTPKLFLVDQHYLHVNGDKLAELLNSRTRHDMLPILIASPEEIETTTKIDDDLYYDYLPRPYTQKQLLRTIKNALNYLALSYETRRVNDLLTIRHKELAELIHIGNQLSAERDHDTLLTMILQKSREITRADSGTLYLVENENTLRFKLSQNDTLQAPYAEFTIPITEQSIAGYVAKNDKLVNLEDTYDLPPDSKFKQNRSFDDNYGYRTKSMLAVPMKDHMERVIGVIQLINKKSDASVKLRPVELTEKYVIPFDVNDERLVESLASQAAVSIENNQLIKNIQNLFEGFVKASVTAVESRDPTTSGHSERVAILTVGLAEAVDRSTDSRFKPVKFSRDQIKEIRYASLLHDFGKVGVREKVLVKSKKLYDGELQLIKSRYDFMMRTLQWKYERKKLELLLAAGREQYLEQVGEFDRDLERELDVLRDQLRLIIAANEPTILEDGSFEQILEIARQSYEDMRGQKQPKVSNDEFRFLSIRRGSLDDTEWAEMCSHVTHSFKFLSKIPWTGELKDIPKIAFGHHEKLDGTGYPNHLTAKDIPIQTRMMTVSDIYDALTANDRPYKPAVSPERALDILGFEVRDGKIDADLVQLFVDAKIYEKTKDYEKSKIL